MAVGWLGSKLLETEGGEKLQRILLRGGKVYTPNPNRQENTILIENDKITGIGSDISRDLPVDQVINLPSQYAISTRYNRCPHSWCSRFRRHG